MPIYRSLRVYQMCAFRLSPVHCILPALYQMKRERKTPKKCNKTCFDACSGELVPHETRERKTPRPASVPIQECKYVTRYVRKRRGTARVLQKGSTTALVRLGRQSSWFAFLRARRAARGALTRSWISSKAGALAALSHSCELSHAKTGSMLL